MDRQIWHRAFDNLTYEKYVVIVDTSEEAVLNRINKLSCRVIVGSSRETNENGKPIIVYWKSKAPRLYRMNADGTLFYQGGSSTKRA